MQGRELQSSNELCFRAWNQEVYSTSWRKKTWETGSGPGWMPPCCWETPLRESGGLAPVSSLSKHRDGLDPVLNACDLSIVHVTFLISTRANSFLLSHILQVLMMRRMNQNVGRKIEQYVCIDSSSKIVSPLTVTTMLTNSSRSFKKKC